MCSHVSNTFLIYSLTLVSNLFLNECSLKNLFITLLNVYTFFFVSYEVHEHACFKFRHVGIVSEWLKLFWERYILKPFYFWMFWFRLLPFFACRTLSLTGWRRYHKLWISSTKPFGLQQKDLIVVILLSSLWHICFGNVWTTVFIETSHILTENRSYALPNLWVIVVANKRKTTVQHEFYMLLLCITKVLFL